MYILKNLNREKRVRTAEESAALQGKGWKLIREKKNFEKPEIDEIADGLSKKLKESIKAMESNQKPEGEAEPGEDAEPEGEAEPGEDAEPEEKPKKSRTKSKE